VSEFVEESVMEKVIYSDPRTSAAEYGLFTSLSMLAAIAGFQSIGITLAAMAQMAAVSLSFSM